MAKIIVGNTLLWLREKAYDAGTEFAVVEAVLEPAATNPVQVDAGTAGLWVRRGKAAVKPAAGKAKP